MARASRTLNRGGRPTRAEAQRRQQHLIEIAGTMFMRMGFDGTSMDSVAEAAGMSKRTVYAHCRDKNELFRAVQRSLIDRWLSPINQFQLGTSELEPMLVEIGCHLLATALARQAVSLHCIIIGESERRPEFGVLANEEGWQPAVRAVAAALRRHAAKLRPLDLERAAEQFMSLVIANKIRLAALGISLDRDAIDRHVELAVDLFLRGACRR